MGLLADLKRLLLSLMAFVLVLLSFSSPSYAQTDGELNIDAIDSANFPQVTVDLTIRDNRGFPVEGIVKGNLSPTEDGFVIPDFQLTPLNQDPIQAVILLDVSGSTTYGKKPTPIQNYVEAAGQFIGSLGYDDQVAVVSFADAVTVHQELTPDKQAAAAALGSLKTGSNTLLNDALVQAAEMLKGSATRPMIILVVDGVESGLSQAEFDAALQFVRQEQIIVYPIAWGGADQEAMKKLAEAAHGEAQFLKDAYPDAATFQAAFNHVLDLLPQVRLQYQLTYASTLPADGKDHQLNVKLDYLNQHIEQARSFFAAQQQVLVTFPSLADGQTVGGWVTLAPQIDAPAAPARVEILLDNQPLTSLVAAPFTFEWDTTNTMPGEHQLTFAATDSSGNTGQASLLLNVQPPVSAKITSPQNGARLEGQVTISADVSGLSKISKVEFLIDEQVIAALDAPPYEVAWSSTKAAAGGHDLRVTALDVNGFTGEDAIRIVAVAPKGPDVGPLALVLAAALGVGLLLVARGRRARSRRLSNASDQPLTAAGALREIQGVNPDKVWPLTTTVETTLGRDPKRNVIPLAGLTASREHASIVYHDGSFMLRNLRPDNPIHLDGQVVTGEALLRPGSSFQAGESVFMFEAQGG